MDVCYVCVRIPLVERFLVVLNTASRMLVETYEALKIFRRWDFKKMLREKQHKQLGGYDHFAETQYRMVKLTIEKTNDTAALRKNGKVQKLLP